MTSALTSRRPLHAAKLHAHRPAALLAAALFAIAMLLLSARAHAAFFAVSVNIAPPVLPVYEQPALPAPGYMWVPGYWSYGDDGYFWVPGTWVEPPAAGLLWTPGYWGFTNGAYIWNAGYWGPQVGFYGGVNYGFGYTGRGYEGGYWQNNQYYYNRSVTNITNTTNITNVYNKTVVNNITVNKVSYNGGPGGLSARPTPQEQTIMHQSHQGPTEAQTAHVTAAAARPELRDSVNHGKPAIAATAKPNSFSAGVVAARGAEHAMPSTAHAAPAEHVPPAAHAAPAQHAPPAAMHERPAAPEHPAPHVAQAPRPEVQRAPSERPSEPRPPSAAREEPRPQAERPTHLAQAPRPEVQHAPPARPEHEQRARPPEPPHDRPQG
jgi:uncharacterized membrane protein